MRRIYSHLVQCSSEQIDMPSMGQACNGYSNECRGKPHLPGLALQVDAQEGDRSFSFVSGAVFMEHH